MKHFPWGQIAGLYQTSLSVPVVAATLGSGSLNHQTLPGAHCPSILAGLARRSSRRERGALDDTEVLAFTRDDLRPLNWTFLHSAIAKFLSYSLPSADAEGC